MEFIVVFVIGALLGLLTGKTLCKVQTIGALLVETTDPDGPFMFLELHKGVGDVSQMEYVNLKVKVDSLNSQK